MPAERAGLSSLREPAPEPSPLQRSEYATLILERLEREPLDLAAQFSLPGRIPSFVLDGLLPEELAREVFAAFPPVERMNRKCSLKESKYYCAQMDRCAPGLEEFIFAFQDPRVVGAFERITGLAGLLPDPVLYAAGVSVMLHGGFLNPHLDNSHDGEQRNYRVLNSLYYATPGWRDEYGGHLELWDRGPRGEPRTIHSRFNRLVMMATERSSWHSVSPITRPDAHDGRRTCVSNYFFRPWPVGDEPYFHATQFRGRPGQPAVDLLLRADNLVRTRILSVVNVPTRHKYRRKDA